MLDLNMIIANNIQAELKKENKKQVDLAEEIGVSKQTMSKIMNLQKKNSQNWKRQRKCQSRLMRIALKPHLSGRLNLEELIRRVTEWMPMEHNHNQEKNV